jgi:CRP-like cAMP-binding protein
MSRMRLRGQGSGSLVGDDMQLSAQENRPHLEALASATNERANSNQTNGVLAALPPAALLLLEPYLRRYELEERSVLWDAGDHIDQLYFPLSGIVSIVMPVKDGHGIEVGSVGREGCAGIECVMGHGRALTRGIVQVAGTFAAISASQFASAARHNDEIRNAAMACHDWILIQSQQLAACNAVHPADGRFCRWLLQSCERLDSDLVPSTQEAIAQLLGIRRTTVTAIAHDLQTAGVISYRRGKIFVRDHDGLRSAACDCYAVLERRYWPSERLARGASEGLASRMGEASSEGV